AVPPSSEAGEEGLVPGRSPPSSVPRPLAEFSAGEPESAVEGDADRPCRGPVAVLPAVGPSVARTPWEAGRFPASGRAERLPTPARTAQTAATRTRLRRYQRRRPGAAPCGASARSD